MRKNCISIIFALLLGIILFGTTGVNANAASVKKPAIESVSKKTGKTIVKFKKTKHTIYYTVNGKKPEKGTSYTKKYNASKGIVITEKKTIKAVAYKGSAKSKVLKKAVDVYSQPQLNKTKVTLEKGEKITLEITNAKTKVQWVSQNEKVATVSSDGIVSGIGKGNTIVKAKVNKTWVTCDVTVKAHKHTYNRVDKKSATCTETGIETYECPCGKTYTKNLEKIGHKYEEVVIEKEPTYEEEGIYKRICKTCGVTLKTGTLAKLVGDTVDSYENCRELMLASVNEERAKMGLAPLELYEPVNGTAQVKAEDLYTTKEFNHYSENLGYFYDQFSMIALQYTAGAENIAYGASTVEAAMSLWMRSEGHKANILNKAYTHIGIGYYKGYWVQQFVANPVIGKTLECMDCGGLINADKYHYFTKDDEGNKYGLYQCKNCYALLEKCPKCEDGFFVDVGITTTGRKSAKCNSCGHHRDFSCIEVCEYCNSSVLGNTINRSYLVTFDSTQTYDGEDYVWENKCYFKQLSVDGDVCKTCNHYVTFVDYTGAYKEALEKLKGYVGSEENVYEYIYWKKVVDYEVLWQEGNTTCLKPIYENVDTPHVPDGNDLIGQLEL